MAVDDFIDIVLIDVAVPHGLRVYDHDGPLIAAIEAAGAIDADFSWAIFLQALDFFFRVGLQLGSATLGAAGRAVLALIDAEKNMLGVIRHGRILYGAIGGYRGRRLPSVGPLKGPNRAA